MSYGAQAYGRLAIGQGEGEFVLQALAGRTRINLRMLGDGNALAEMATRPRVGLRLAGGTAVLAHLGGAALVMVAGKAQPMGSGNLYARLRTRVWLKTIKLGGNHVVIGLQVLDQGPLVVAGTLKEWTP